MGSSASKGTDAENETSVDLYHYTDAKGVTAILKSGRIRSSTNTGVDATFGQGVYLTSFKPDDNKIQILKNNYDDNVRSGRFDGKADYYFKFKSTDLPGVTKAKNITRDVWLYPADLVLANVDYVCGKTDDSRIQEYRSTYDGHGNAVSVPNY